MTVHTFRYGGLLAVAAMLVLAACGTRETADPPAEATETTETTDSPGTEGTGPEPPRTEDGGVSVSLPGLPVGGFVNDKSQVRQCVIVAWMAGEDLLDGDTVVPAEVRLEPPGVFEVDGSSCGEVQGCTASFEFTSTPEPCSVPVRALATDGASAELWLSGTARCADAESCEDFAANVSGESIPLTQPHEEPEPYETTPTS